MAKIEATMSAGFQITVPSAVRKLLDLKPGDKLVFDTETSEVDEEGAVATEIEVKRVAVEKAMTREERIRQTFRELDRLKKERERQMTQEQKEFAEKSAGWTVNQYHEYFDNLPETKVYIKEKYGV